MSMSAVYAFGAFVYIFWAIHRLYVAWKNSYVTEVDDPHFGFETARISRSTKPKVYWLSITITSLLLAVALIFLFFISADLMSAQALG